MRPLTSAAYLAWRHALRTQHDRAQLSQKVLYTNYDTTNIKTPISIHRNQKKKDTASLLRPARRPRLEHLCLLHAFFPFRRFFGISNLQRK